MVSQEIVDFVYNRMAM